MLVLCGEAEVCVCVCVKITPEEGAEGLRGGGGGPVDAVEPARRWASHVSDDPDHISDDRQIS